MDDEPAGLLVEGFVAGLGRAADGRPPAPGLVAALRQAVATARAAWPGVEVPDQDLAAMLGQRVVDADDAVAAVGRLPAPDLLLALGCCRGDRVAAEAFDRELAPLIRAASFKVSRDRDLAEEMVQHVFEKVFLGTERDEPRISGFVYGSLRSWLAVVASRAAIDRQRVARRSVPLTDSLVSLVATGDDLGGAHLRATYRANLRDAVEQALGALDARDRVVLRYTLDGRTADEIAAVFGVHRVTVARWLSALRSSLGQRIRGALGRELRLPAAEVESVLRAVDGSLSVSLDRLLADPG